MRVLLFAGHPGHELRIHRWLHVAKPAAVVLTQGIDCFGGPSIALTKRVLADAGVRRGPVFGRFDDREVYRRLLAGSFDAWQEIVLELADYVCEEQFDMVAGDAREGFSPTHDLCHCLRNAVVAIAERRLKRPIRNYQYQLARPPRDVAVFAADVVLKLSADELEAKRAAARAFEDSRPDIAEELHLPADFHQQEVLTPADVRPCAEFVAPDYEAFGRRRVAEGKYARCLTYREHLRPMEVALAEFAAKAA